MSRILVHGDEGAAAEALREAGHSVEVESGIQNALRAAGAGRFDAIIVEGVRDAGSLAEMSGGGALVVVVCERPSDVQEDERLRGAAVLRMPVMGAEIVRAVSVFGR